MIKYTATAFALKAFSVSRPSRTLYRYLGNTFGGRDRARTEMPDYYVERVERMLRLANQYGVLKDGARVLELGTGWIHWEALTTRLFFDTKADLYDVWDNRQFAPLKTYLSRLLDRFDELTSATPAQKERARKLANQILELPDFDALYRLLGFRYVLDPQGLLKNLGAGEYDLVVSAGVFEHLPRATVPEYIRETFRVLKPGGFGVHSINTTDHLHLYDPSASPKNYLRYSNRRWEMLFENELQYINRLQRCEWMDIFRQAGFTCAEESGPRCDLSDLTVHPQYQHMDRVSLETTSWHAVYQKPAATARA